MNTHHLAGAGNLRDSIFLMSHGKNRFGSVAGFSNGTVTSEFGL